MEPPKTPAQLAAQKYEIVETFGDIVEKGVSEAHPIPTLVTNGKAPEEEPSKTEYGRAAVAAFCAEHLAFAPPEDMTDRPEPLLRVKFLDNVTIVDFRAYEEWEAYGGKYIPFDRRTGGRRQRMKTLCKTCQLPLDIVQMGPRIQRPPLARAREPSRRLRAKNAILGLWDPPKFR